jgi:hypothetical protein
VLPPNEYSKSLPIYLTRSLSNEFASPFIQGLNRKFSSASLPPQ